MAATMMISAAEGPNWSDLPGELLNTIGQRVTKLEDFIRFQFVCKPWRRALAGSRFRQSIPWLMLPYCRNDTTSSSRAGCIGTDSCRCFYDPDQQQFHHIELPHGLNKTCRGSAFGWVFMMERWSTALSLLNPVTKDRIDLPPITAFPDVLGFCPEKVGMEYLYLNRDGQRVAKGNKNFERNYIGKVALSAEPTSEECVVMVVRKIGDCTLAYCRPHCDQSWTLIPRGDGDHLPIMIPFVDVVFWRGQFYALADDGGVYVCDLSLPHCPKLSLHSRPTRLFGATNYYLLTSPASDELMVVTRDVSYPADEYYDEDELPEEEEEEEEEDDDDDDGNCSRMTGVPGRPYGDCEVDTYAIDSESDGDDYRRESQVLTSEFRVFRTTKGDGKEGWDEVESIGEDFALFLGFNTAIWVSTRDHPEFAPNSIYFSDDMTDLHHRNGKYAGSDMGVYDLATHTISPFYCTASLHKNPSLIFPLPVWILPSSH